MQENSKNDQKTVILAVTFGNILEWFDIYSYAYWAIFFSKIFFGFQKDLSNLISVFILFGIGFIVRPLGAIYFGHMGDTWGRKKPFILSIIFITIPTFLMGFLPTYEQVGFYAPLFMALLRIMQSFPSAGEAPGAFCYLYESADHDDKKYMTSWGGVGNQIGAILSVLECYLLEKFLPEDFLMTWGWRISFISGGLLGLLGIYLRNKLHETPLFQRLKEHHNLNKDSIPTTIKDHKNGILIGTAYGALNASTFYLVASFIPIYFDNVIGLGRLENTIIILSILLISTILLPFFGMLGDRISIRKILVVCAVTILIMLIPLYISIVKENLISIATLGFLFIFPITCITALIPYLLTHLFPTSVRFTCVGLSFNLADGIIGGFTPAISLFLLQLTGSQAAFCLYILLTGVVSLAAYTQIKE